MTEMNKIIKKEKEGDKKLPGYIINKDRARKVIEEIQGIFKKHDMNILDITFVVGELVEAVEMANECRSEMALRKALKGMMEDIQKRRDL